MASRKIIRCYEDPTGGSINAAAFHPDGTALASACADASIKVSGNREHGGRLICMLVDVRHPLLGLLNGRCFSVCMLPEAACHDS